MAQEQIPQYAMDFEEWDPIRQREVFTRIGFPDQTSERLFRLLCLEAAEKRSNLVKVHDLLERVLRWAAHPEHQRQQPRFPRAASVLQNRLAAFVQLLAASGLCEIEQEGAVLRLHPLDRVSELSAKARFADTVASIHAALTAASADPGLSFPGVDMLSREGKRLARTQLSHKEFNQSLILDSGDPGDTLLEISFPSGEGELVFPRSLVLEVKRVAMARMMAYVDRLVNHLTEDASNMALSRVNNMLQSAFPSGSPGCQYTLERLYAAISGANGSVDEQFDVWSAVSRSLIDQLNRSRESDEDAVALKQSLILLYSWFSYARDMELKVKAGEMVLLDIRNHMAAFPRCITEHEILQRKPVKEYCAKYGAEDFAALFRRFLRENDVRSPEAVPGDCIISLEPEDGAVAFIHTAGAADFMSRRLEVARDRKLGLVAQEYLLPWQALLRRDLYSERAAAVLSNEKKFHSDLEVAFARRYPYLQALLAFAGAVPDLLIHICERAEIPLNRFLTLEGKMKSVAALLPADRHTILKRLNKTLPLWQRLAMRLLRFFFSREQSRSLWPLIHGALHGREEKREPVKKAQQTDGKVRASELYHGAQGPDK